MEKRHLFIISRRAPRMYEAVKTSFAGHADIEVTLDRRRRERRWETLPVAIDRRRKERRTVDIAALLRRLGWVIVKRQAAVEGEPDPI